MGITTSINLLKRQVPPQEQFEFTQEHPLNVPLKESSLYADLLLASLSEVDWLKVARMEWAE